MTTHQLEEKTKLLSDVEKAALSQVEKPSEQGWYPDPLGEGAERFFSTELGQWTGRTRGNHAAPKRDLSQFSGSVPSPTQGPLTGTARVRAAEASSMAARAKLVSGILTFFAVLWAVVYGLAGLFFVFAAASAGAPEGLLFGLAAIMTALVGWAVLSLGSVVAKYIAWRVESNQA
jgi:hypothetical protein